MMDGLAFMQSGYAYCLAHRDWQHAPNDDWDTVCYTSTGEEMCVGRRRIDGSICCVFRCADGQFRAQLAVLCVR